LASDLLTDGRLDVLLDETLLERLDVGLDEDLVAEDDLEDDRLDLLLDLDLAPNTGSQNNKSATKMHKRRINPSFLILDSVF